VRVLGGVHEGRDALEHSVSRAGCVSATRAF
jgi:hypothetical protein